MILGVGKTGMRIGFACRVIFRYQETNHQNTMIVFLHIPKTGGTSFQYILESNFGMSHCRTNHTKKSVFSQTDFNFARKLFPRLRSLGGHNLVDPLSLSVPDPFYLTFLRDPVARVLSHYQDSVVRGNNRKSFEESLNENEDLENLQVKLMAGGRNLGRAKLFLEKCDFVGLTEKFDLSLNVLQRLDPHGLDLAFRRRIVARDNTIKNRLKRDLPMMELARERNQLDLELYTFAVNDVFPRLCAKAGIKPTDQVRSFELTRGGFGMKYVLGRCWNRLVFRQFCKMR